MRRPIVRTPVSTYRLQLTPDFTFRDAAEITPYLAGLGVTECYASPYMRARPGSRHGYDVCDYNSLNPEFGDQKEYISWMKALAAAELGHIIDWVPNHMSVDPSTNA